MAVIQDKPLKELRIGLVLYGGASLAVYMNGIVTEMWQALRGSQARQHADGAKPGGTAEIYKALLDALAASADAVDLRIVVDAVAGTSAGGLNGAVLAKAIVDGGDARVLNDVWINDGDMTNLRAEPAERAPLWLRWPLDACTALIPPMCRMRKAVEALPGLDWAWARDQIYSFLVSKDGSKTILNGTYFAAMIANTFKRMAANRGPALLPRYGTLDLFLTRTDFHGWPRHLPVSPTFQAEPLFERTHAHWMQFARRPHAADGGGASPVEVAGFDETDYDFSLTYATRTTAGFPIAFAPVSFSEVKAAYLSKRPGDPVPREEDFSRRHLPEHRLARSAPGWNWTSHAWMVDGGILDNKPFTYVTQAIEHKPADHEVFRVVAYIEPDPETDIDQPSATPPPPMAMAQGLFGLFRHEPIYADLRRLNDRNATVDRIADMLAAGRDNAIRAAKKAGQQASPRLDWPPRAAQLESWRAATNAYVASEPLSGYPGYVALKVRRAVDVLATLVCRSLDYPYDARHAYFIRLLLRAWFERKDNVLSAPTFVEAEEGSGGRGGHAMDSQLHLLSAFDIPFRLRRLRFMAGSLRRHYAGADDAQRCALDTFKIALARSVFAYESRLGDQGQVRGLFENILGPDIDAQIDKAIETVKFEPTSLIEQHGKSIESIYDGLSEQFARLGDDQNQVLTQAIGQLPDGVRDAVVEDYVIFPFFDLLAFPLMDSAGIEDLISVQTMRIAPQDVATLSQDAHRLKGREMGAFAGFLRRSARENDLLWGRLDGADRLIDVMVRAAAARVDADEKYAAALEAIRDKFKARVMKTILDEEAARPATSVTDTVAAIRTALARSLPSPA